ncbi:hypothetical protein [Crossiella sp. CA198]|uniref:hypothetical protein n=1 Tax=Crossiella sp. CA198 TaxID=3455607 RepID=UPI003F8D5F87
MFEDEAGPPAPQPPEDELRRIVAAFDGYLGYLGELEPWEHVGSDTAPWGRAKVCRVRPGRVLHVIGASEMAEALRDLLSTGAVVGWQLHPMAATRTPLDHYLPQFKQISQRQGGARGYKQLEQTGFAFGEEVAACPDSVLLATRNIGDRALATIRRIIGGPPSAGTELAERIDMTAGAPTSPMEGDEPVSTQSRADLFSAASQARYPDLVRGLAGSAVPVAALGKIAEALNGEELPTADSLVLLLLETAGQRHLLQLYRATHTEPQS